METEQIIIDPAVTRQETTVPEAQAETREEQVEAATDPAPGAEEIARLMAEAEQRGYLRARNEIAEQLMSRPELFENPLRGREGREKPQSLAEGFLSELPRGVWD
ncbi:MAG: hypothetical protein K2G01_09600 [Paramuribaculum sp.]|nr:hypothetical protein [Paramuribaculum sp.]MDE6324306.1 hypothetical protein [Paramuribaculum sp.]